MALAYTFQPQGGSALTQGSFTVEGGILNFGSGAGQAIEIPSRAAILRPGDNTTAPVAFVNPPSGYFAVSGRVDFIFTGLMGAQAATNLNTYNAAYGRVAVSTTPDGTGWTFGDELKFQIPSAAADASRAAPIPPAGRSPIPAPARQA